MKIVFIGDIVGKEAKQTVLKIIPDIRSKYLPDAILACVSWICSFILLKFLVACALNNLVLTSIGHLILHQLEFEKAQQIKEKINLLKVYNNKSTVVNPKFKNIEVYGIIDDEKNVYVNYMKINNGIMLGGETIKLRKKIDLNESLIKYLIFHFKNKYKTHDYNIISNYKLNSFINNIKVFCPKAGDKKKLIDLSLKNALFYKEHFLNLNQLI